MNFPNFPNKQRYAGILNASNLLAQRGTNAATLVRGAKVALICLQTYSLRYTVKRQRGKKLNGLSGEVYALKKTNSQILAVKPVGVGAPSLTVLLEELAVCGIRRFIMIGIAGTISHRISTGEIIFPTSAIRDEGTSHHYLPSDLPAQPSNALQNKLAGAVESRGIKYSSGVVWTTDAPFRETAEEILHYQQQGVLAVEMECAAFFSVCSALNLESACGLVAVDSLASAVWRPPNHAAAVERSFQILADTSIEVLTS